MGFLESRSSRCGGRAAYALAEAVIALGVAATGLGGILSAVSVGMAVSRDASMRTRAVHLGRTILASPATVVDYEGRERFADAGGFDIRDAPFDASCFSIRVERSGGAATNTSVIPLCLTIRWSNGQGALRLMTAVPAPPAGGER